MDFNETKSNLQFMHQNLPPQQAAQIIKKQLAILFPKKPMEKDYELNKKIKPYLVKNINNLYFFRPKKIKINNRFYYLNKSLSLPLVTYYTSSIVTKFNSTKKKEFEEKFNKDFKNYEYKIRLIENPALTFREKKRLAGLKIANFRLSKGFDKDKQLNESLDVQYAKNDPNKIYYHFKAREGYNAKKNDYDGKDYNNKNDFNNINKFLTNVNKRVNFNIKQTKKTLENDIKTVAVLNSQNYSPLVKLKFWKRLLKTLFIVYLTQKKNNLFININTNFNRMLYKLSVGFLEIEGKEKKLPVTIRKFAGFFIRFCRQNNFDGNYLCLKSKGYRIYKLAVRLQKNSQIKFNFYTNLRFYHSKPLTGRKKRRV